MTAHDEIIELLGAFALDAVDADEADLVERHLAECPRCAAEVAEHREVAALLAHTGAPAPEGVWDRIAASIDGAAPVPFPGTEAPAAPVAPVVPLRPRRWRTIAASGLAAAAVLIIALLGVTLSRQSERIDDLQTALGHDSLGDAAELAFADAHAAHYVLRSEDGVLSSRAVVRPSGTGFIDGSSLPALAGGQTYQLWGIRGINVVSLGLMGQHPETVAFGVDQPLDGLAVTVEVAGGVVSSQNPPVVADVT